MASNPTASLRRMSVHLTFVVVGCLAVMFYKAPPPRTLSTKLTAPGPSLYRAEYYVMSFDSTYGDRAALSAEDVAAKLRFSFLDLPASHPSYVADAAQQQRRAPAVCSSAQCIELNADAETLEWLRHILKHERGDWSLRGYKGLKRLGLKHADAAAVMHLLRNTGPEMFMMSSGQWRDLLHASGASFPLGRALDIGAGVGDITRRIAPLFTRGVLATEVGTFVAMRLRMAGFTVVQTDLPTAAVLGETGFDTIFMMNVVDRCEDHMLLLGEVKKLLAPKGKLVVSLPLPTFDLKTLMKDTTWADAVDGMTKTVFAPLGLRVDAVTRAPYLSQGGEGTVNPVFVLDAAVFVVSAV